MIEFENAILIERPVAEVFAFLADVENFPKWNYYVVEVRKISEGPAGVGTTYHLTRKTDEQYLLVVEFEQNHRIALQTGPESFPGLEMRFSLTRQGDATHIRDEWKLQTGTPALLERLGARRIRSAAAENLIRLKELLEEGRTVLQDGRLATR